MYYGMLKCPWKQKEIEKNVFVRTFLSRSILKVLGMNARTKQLADGQRQGKKPRRANLLAA